MDIKITIDPSYKRDFKRLEIAIDKSIHKGLRLATLDLESTSKKNFGKSGHLKSRTGKLRQSIHSKFSKLSSSVSSDMIYAAIHQFGGTILPRNGKYLIFNIGNRIVSVKKVVMPARPFIIPNEKRISEVIHNQLKKDIDSVQRQ